MGNTDVIVGFDGSPTSGDALRWAAAEAARTGARLRVVLAYHWRWAAAIVGTDQLDRSARDQAGALVEAAARRARAQQPGIDVSAHAIVGDATDTLIDMARDAAVVVVGHRGHNAVSAAVLGETGGRVAAHAHGRVVVVRGRVDAATGPVVVGVDGSCDDDRLLSIGFEQAARRRCDLAVVRSFAPAEPHRGIDRPPDRHRVRTRAAPRLALIDDVQRWRKKYPTVPAGVHMTTGHPASVLIDASREAQLLVAGTRGYAGVMGLLVGSVSQQLLHHCDCPLMIVRAPHDAG